MPIHRVQCEAVTDPPCGTLASADCLTNSWMIPWAKGFYSTHTARAPEGYQLLFLSQLLQKVGTVLPRSAAVAAGWEGLSATVCPLLQLPQLIPQSVWDLQSPPNTSSEGILCNEISIGCFISLFSCYWFKALRELVLVYFVWQLPKILLFAPSI